MPTITIYGILDSSTKGGQKSIKAYAANRELAEEISKEYGNQRDMNSDKPDEQFICPIELHCTEEMAEFFAKQQQPKVSAKVNKKDDVTESAKVSRKPIPDDTFVLVEASKLSLEDDFMKFNPQTENQINFKNDLESAIKSGLKDFYRAKYGPYANVFGEIMFGYKSGVFLATGYSFNWWATANERYYSSYEIRLGTKNEYVAFLGDIIKKLVKYGCSIKNAWEIICDDTCNLNKIRFNYNSKKEEREVEDLVECIRNLARNLRILAWDDEAGGFWETGSYHRELHNPLTEFVLRDNKETHWDKVLGWCVIEK